MMVAILVLTGGGPDHSGQLPRNATRPKRRKWPQKSIGKSSLDSPDKLVYGFAPGST
jgi:hypothetical protein